MFEHIHCESSEEGSACHAFLPDPDDYHCDNGFVYLWVYIWVEILNNSAKWTKRCQKLNEGFPYCFLFICEALPSYFMETTCAR